MKKLLTVLFFSGVVVLANAQPWSAAWQAAQVKNSSGGGGDVAGESALYYLDNNASDSSGNGFNLALNGSPAFVTSLNGSTANGALSFNGSSQSASQTTASTIVNPSTTDFTITGSVNATTFQNNAGYNVRVLSQNIDGNNLWQLTLGDKDSGTQNTFAFVVYSGGGDFSVMTQSTFSPATTYFIALIWNHTSQTAAIWINGVLATTIGQLGYGTGIADNKFWMGARSDSNGWFSGTLDDVRIYPRILTSTEIGQLNTNGAKQ